MKKVNDSNIFAQQGVKFSDTEVIETFGLDPALAGTEQLNETMYDLMYDKNVQNFMLFENMSEKDAKREAGRLRKSARL